MTSAKAICEEFSEEVYCLYQFNIQEPSGSTQGQNEVGGSLTPSPTGEIKCSLDTKYFVPLLERLRGVGYCCTQVQKNPTANTCTAWFEPVSPD